MTAPKDRTTIDYQAQQLALSFGLPLVPISLVRSPEGWSKDGQILDASEKYHVVVQRRQLIFFWAETGDRAGIPGDQGYDLQFQIDEQTFFRFFRIVNKCADFLEIQGNYGTEHSVQGDLIVVLQVLSDPDVIGLVNFRSSDQQIEQILRII